MLRVFIDGKEGTTGLRIYDRISSRPDCELLVLPESERKSKQSRRDIIRSCDVVFLCLPDDAAKESADFAAGSGVKIIDASTAHRTSFVYGFPELDRYDDIRKASRIAVPGCHATGFLALTVPLIGMGLLKKESLLSFFSITGYSGGGKSMISDYESNFYAPKNYSLGQAHKHLKEIEHISGLAPVFNPVIGHFYAGMLVTIPIHAGVFSKKIDIAGLRAIYGEYYAGRPVISVLPDCPGTLEADALAGSDGIEIMVGGNDERINLMARYDNLGKGASGAAIQCFNILTGADEACGLNL